MSDKISVTGDLTAWAAGKTSPATRATPSRQFDAGSDPTDVFSWRAGRECRRGRSSPAAPQQETSASIRRSLTAVQLPAITLEAVNAAPVSLADLTAGWLVVYCVPGAHLADGAYMADDERDRRAYARCESAFRSFGVSIASLSSEPKPSQIHSMLRHRVIHHMFVDDELLIADALPLPRLSASEGRGYRRLALVALDGVIQHVFYPVAGGGVSARQVAAWIAVHGHPNIPGAA
jgi:peroxiredoxin